MSAYLNILFILLLIKYALQQLPVLDNRKKQVVFLIVASIFFTLLTGLRDQYTGTDTDGYIRTFFRYRQCATPFEIFELDVKNKEYGYALWAWIIGYFTDNPNVYFTITASFFSYSLAKFIHRNSKDYFLSIILYYTVGMFSFQMTGMRQAMAMAILLFGFEFIKERKLIRFILIVWLASLFHKSSFAFLLAYPFAYMKINFKNAIIVFGMFISSIVYGAKLSQLLGKLIGYEQKIDAGKYGDIGGETVIGMLLISIIIAYIFSKKISQQSKHNLVFFNLTVYALGIYILRYNIHILERVSYYYQYAFIILLPNAIEAITDNKTKKVVYACALTLACLLFFYRTQLKGTSYYGFLIK